MKNLSKKWNPRDGLNKKTSLLTKLRDNDIQQLLPTWIQKHVHDLRLAAVFISCYASLAAI